MKRIFYDWLGFNEWLFKVLHSMDIPLWGALWRVLSYAYSYWVIVFMMLVLAGYYLQSRHTVQEPRLTAMSDIMATLILGFSLVWCVVYTVQTVTFWPAPAMVYPGTSTGQGSLLWHEGFPASAPAIAMLISCIFWRHVAGVGKWALAVYVALGCFFSVVTGQNWPVDVAFGLIVGAGGVYVARVYFQFGRKVVNC